MSEVRIQELQLLRQAAEPSELLAVSGLRRSLESEPADQLASRLVPAMIPPRDLELTMVQLAELIAAIDRRLPQVQRSGEAAIANAAVRLRIEASRRIAEIEQELAGRTANVRPAILP
jgi:hypothetical protein